MHQQIKLGGAEKPAGFSSLFSKFEMLGMGFLVSVCWERDKDYVLFLVKIFFRTLLLFDNKLMLLKIKYTYIISHPRQR